MPAVLLVRRSERLGSLNIPGSRRLSWFLVPRELEGLSHHGLFCSGNRFRTKPVHCNNTEWAEVRCEGFFSTCSYKRPGVASRPPRTVVW